MKPFTTITRAGALTAIALSAHTWWNLRHWPAPEPVAAVDEPVRVLVPARNEASNITGCLDSLLAQQGVPDLQIHVLDDASSDATAAAAERISRTDPRVRLTRGTGDPPPGWLGKPYACHRLARLAGIERGVLVFVDADVRLEPGGLAATVAALRAQRAELLCPYPRQLADGMLPRLVQPLLQWSFLTTLPLPLAHSRSERWRSRGSLTAANGQLLAVDARAYRDAGGHGAVRGQVVEDVALARTVKASGGRAVIADGTRVAVCRMYRDAAELRAGYAKSLSTAFGGPVAGCAVAAGLVWIYVLPVAGALRGDPVSAAGYLAAVASRVLVARRAASRLWPDCAAHPASVAAFAALMAASVRSRRAGTASWKGRPV